MTKIISQIKKRLAKLLLGLALAFDSATLASRALSLVAWWVPDSVAEKQPRILCMGRTIFVDDVKAMAKYSGRIEYAVIHRDYFKQIFGYFVSEEERKMITERNYHVTEIGRAGREKYAAFLMRMLPLLQKRLGFAGVLSGNIGYIEQQETEKVSSLLGVPFVVLHKEAMEIFRGNVSASYENIRFAGRKMLFYNERIRTELLQMKLPGLTENNSEVVGMPRIDHYFSKSFEKPRMPQITLFTTHTESYFIYLRDDKEKLAAIQERIAEFYRLVMEYALHHPEVRVVIKTKSASLYMDRLNAVKEKFFKEQIIPNLVITSSADPAQLICDSSAVLGYNSTTLIEAILCGKMVITPDFRDLIPEPEHDYFGNHPALAHSVRTLPELEEFLSHPEKYSAADQEKTVFLSELIYLPDGHASERAEAAILRTINQR